VPPAQPSQVQQTAAAIPAAQTPAQQI
jgi:hypothetical protein